MLQRYILVWLLVTSGTAYFWPLLGISFDPFLANGGPAVHWLIIVTMTAVGALLTTDEVDDVFRRWPTVLFGTCVQYTCMPLLAWLAVTILKPNPETAAGIIIVGCVPGAMASNVLTLTARGNVSYSVSLTTMATMLSPLVVPAAMWLTMSGRIQYDASATIRLMLLQIVLPVTCGHLFSRFLPAVRRLSAQYASVVANTSILSIIAIAVALKRPELALAGPALLTVLALINLGGYCAGYFSGRLLRLPEPMRRALTLEVGMQNAGAGVALADRLFGDHSAAIIPCILYTSGCMLTGTILATYWHHRRIGEPVEETPLSGRGDSAT
ncbi:MAG: bile acid:sodium symporter family protein [Planctomycetaceae bacterium]|nr:bile acid:sodium symporter family protein [Planctomycetaceae bacterium]